jgi:CO/xanthine dehydrogenase Mo-binding subunit
MDALTAMTREVGRSIPRLEARDKVTGRAEYVHNLSVPGMLHAKIFRSTVPHGKITSIDVAEAQKVAGVVAVLTGDDIRRLVPEPYFGPAFHDQPVLALGKVHYVGEPVAVVLAENRLAAEEAALLVGAEYEELPAVFDEVEAVESPVIVHDVLTPAGTFADLKHLHGRRDTNVALDYHMRLGDVEAAFRCAPHIFEHEFKTQTVTHVPLEPMVSLAVPERGHLTIHTASQSPSFVRAEIARLLGWPQNKIRVKVPFVGGGFGAKLYIKLEALAACAALLVRRPVKISLAMDEQVFTITKHATTFRIKSAVTAEGKVNGRRCEVYWNGGAFADIGPRVSQKSGFTAPGPYGIENVWIDSYQIYTNLPPAGALRGFGVPQLVWAYECHTDLIARGLGMDPLEFRRRNILRDNKPQATGTPTTDAAIAEVLETLAKALSWDKPFDRGQGSIRRGRGIAIGFKASISPTTSVAAVMVNPDGSVILSVSTVDMGQGSDTVMAQIAAETLGIRAQDVRVVHSDTDSTPYDMATLGSRSTFHMGNAVKLAAEDALRQLRELAAGLGLPPDAPVAPAELFLKRYSMQAGAIIGVGSFIPDYTPPDPDGLSANVTPFWMIGGTGVEVEVDTETGRVEVLRLVNAADVGKPLNPKIVETQLSGASLMQLGFTLFEKVHFEDGQVTNPSFVDYKICGIHDVPRTVKNVIVEANQRTGPYGAKGVGETATFAVSPAIANAIQDAAGVRLKSLPITPEAVLRAIREAAGKPLEN